LVPPPGTEPVDSAVLPPALGLLQDGDARAGFVRSERGRESGAAGADDQDIDRGVEVARGVGRWHAVHTYLLAAHTVNS